jgi:predicted DNA-binding transcriptional regulator AlpA
MNEPLQAPIENGAVAPTLLNVHQVSAILGCVPHTVRAWVRQGKFPAPLRLAYNMCRWDLDDVLAFLGERAADGWPLTIGRRPSTAARQLLDDTHSPAAEKGE